MQRWLLALVVLAGCSGRSTRQQPAADDARRHDDRSHDENHYYVAVTRTRLDPPTLTVPHDQDVILLFDRRPDAECAAIRVELGPGRVIEQALTQARPLEVHARFDIGGPYAYRCTSGPLNGTIDVR